MKKESIDKTCAEQYRKAAISRILKITCQLLTMVNMVYRQVGSSWTCLDTTSDYVCSDRINI